jgi:hypothetical protein
MSVSEPAIAAHSSRSLLDALIGTRPFRGADQTAFAVHGDVARLPALFHAAELSGLDALAQRYRGPLSFGRGLRHPQTFDITANAANLSRLGLTVYLRDIAPVLPGGQAFLRLLEHELGIAEGAARLTAFASPAEDGVSCHFDGEDVISVQLLGRKTFQIAPMTEIDSPCGAQYGPGMVATDDLFEQITTTWPDATTARFEPIDMRPGSVLYLPRGTWHRTEAQEASLSVSIVLRPATAADALLAQLRPLLLRDAAWRRPIYGARPDSEPRSQSLASLRRLLDGLPERLRVVSPEALAPTSIDERIAAIGPTSRLLRVPTSQITTDTVSPLRLGLRITAWDQAWVERETLNTEVPASLRPVIDRIAASCDVLRPSALQAAFPALPDRDLLQLLQLLTRAHALRLLTPT